MRAKLIGLAFASAIIPQANLKWRHSKLALILLSEVAGSLHEAKRLQGSLVLLHVGRREEVSMQVDGETGISKTSEIKAGIFVFYILNFTK